MAGSQQGWRSGVSGGSTSGVQSVTGLNTDNTDPLNPIINISVDGVTITGDGTPLNPLVSVADGVQSVTGLDTDNTDPLNPIVNISVDGVTITGNGTPLNPLVSVTNIPQSNIIYIDSNPLIGINSTGRGNINNPYLTPEYALADITNTGTVTATTTNLSATLTAVSSTANIVVGQFITGTGIPYNSIVVSKTSNTIVLSQVCTANGTITATWWTVYEVILNGSFTVVTNLHKSGFWIDWETNNASISFGNLTLFTLTANLLIPWVISAGNTYGTHAGSKFIESGGFSYINLNLDYGNYYSIGTDYQIGAITGLTGVNAFIKGIFLNVLFGKVCNTLTASTIKWDGDSYGLLEGIKFNASQSSTISGYHQTPPSIQVFYSGTYCNSLANFRGSTVWYYYSSHIGMINGTSHSMYYSTVNASNRSSGSVTIVDGNNILQSDGSDGFSLIVNSGTTLTLEGSVFIPTSTINGTLINSGRMGGGSNSWELNGIFINNGYVDFSTNARGITLGTSSTLRNNSTMLLGRINTTGNGFYVENYGTITIKYYGISLTNNGTFLNKGKIASNDTFVAYNDAMVLLNSASAIFRNYGILENLNNEATSVITKTLGSLYLYTGSTLVVANASSPIKCTANTSASKDVYYFNAVTNCNGSTYGLLFAFDGGSFAPNDLVGGVLYENVNY